MALFRFCVELIPLLAWFSDRAKDLLSRFMQAAVDVKNMCQNDPLMTGDYFDGLYHKLQLPPVPSMEVLEVITPRIEADLRQGLVPGPQATA